MILRLLLKALSNAALVRLSNACTAERKGRVDVALKALPGRLVGTRG